LFFQQIQKNIFMSIFSSTKDTKDSSFEVNTPSSSSEAPSTPSASSNSFTAKPITTISEGASIDGNLKVEGDVRVEGLVKGTVTSKGRVIIGNSGRVEGDILCQTAEISGKIDGKLKIADILFLKSSALVDGDINTGKLVMESGVKFNGNCVMGSMSTVSPAASTTSTPKASTSTPPTSESI